ncbi:MFS transporter, partial [Brevundimonas sp.]|uniref:MFS transporter n=1 Tax=Brevundimonas sp. TaxID=1871086 RepID=UPI0035B41B68
MSTPPASSRSLKALSAVNFFLADVRDGLGPFLGVYLVAQGWSPDHIGYVFTLSSLAAMAATGPAGAWVDRTRAKRMFLSVCAFIVAVGAATVLISSAFPVITAAQVAMGAAGAARG